MTTYVGFMAQIMSITAGSCMPRTTAKKNNRTTLPEGTMAWSWWWPRPVASYGA